MLFKRSPPLCKLTHAKCLKRDQNTNPGTPPWAAQDKQETVLAGQQILGLPFSLPQSSWPGCGHQLCLLQSPDVHGSSSRLVLIWLTWAEMMRDNLMLSTCWMGLKGHNFLLLQGAAASRQKWETESSCRKRLCYHRWYQRL